MPPISLRALAQDTLEERAFELELQPGATSSLRLHGLPGASSIHCEFEDENRLLRRIAVPVSGDEVVVLEAHLREDGSLRLESTGRRILSLAGDSSYRPVRPFEPRHDSGEVDVALVLDGTTRLVIDEKRDEGPLRLNRPKLLSLGKRWQAHGGQMLRLLDLLAGEDRDLRLSVMAFGDKESKVVTAKDLKPTYLLHPDREDSRRLAPYDRERARDLLAAIPSTSGGDFVDALAEALQACRELRWRPDARKLLIVSGDSPGHALWTPPPKGADLLVRHLDVEVEALGLHAQGVEILTVYHDEPPKDAEFNLDRHRKLLAHAERQYRDLATIRDYALQLSAFEPAEVLDRLRSVRGPLGRGTAPGIFLDG